MIPDKLSYDLFSLRGYSENNTIRTREDVHERDRHSKTSFFAN
jgi:hypothetical protein